MYADNLHQVLVNSKIFKILSPEVFTKIDIFLANTDLTSEQKQKLMNIFDDVFDDIVNDSEDCCDCNCSCSHE
jgi:hypothetical protein